LHETDTRSPRPLITATTCVAAVAFTFLWQEGGVTELMRMNEDAVGSEPWRLVSSTLSHSGFLHLLFNVYWLWHLGRALEARLPSGAVLGIYGLTAGASAAAQFAVSAGGIGLSGLVYGLAAFLWVAGRHRRGFAGTLDDRTLRFFGIWFLLCIALTRLEIYPIANTAHGVGALLGALVAWAWSAPRPASWIRWSSLASASLLCLAAPRLVPITWLATPDLYRRVAERIERGAEGGSPDELLRLTRVALEREGASRELYPGADYLWYVAAHYEWVLERPEVALADARRALEVNADSAPARRILARLLTARGHGAFRNGDDAAALSDLHESVELDPELAAAWENLALVLQAAGRDEEAGEARRRAYVLRRSQDPR